MVITQKLGNLKSYEDEGRVIDRLPVEWHQTSKRILHVKTQSGKALVLKFLKESPDLQQDDILYADDKLLIVVEIIACDAIVIQPSSMKEMAYACYEIGNKHLPLFYEDDMLLIPYDAPVYRNLNASNFSPKVQKKRLVNQLKTTVSPHGHSTGESLFSKIMKLTTPSNNE